jgi:hypothetical protein
MSTLKSIAASCGPMVSPPEKVAKRAGPALRKGKPTPPAAPRGVLGARSGSLSQSIAPNAPMLHPSDMPAPKAKAKRK